MFHFPRPKSHYTSKRVLRKGAPRYHVQKPDTDNLAKFVLDSLNGVYYKDDCQIVELAITKAWVDCGREGVHVRMEPHTGDGTTSSTPRHTGDTARVECVPSFQWPS